MKKRIKKLFICIGLLAIISITGVYAVTIIKASDVIYDTSKSGGSSSNVQGAIDELYSLAGYLDEKLINENMISYITELSKKDKINLANDGTTDNNLRYIGTNPNNYVEFNGELWRIIGVMNNIKDSKGKSASRVKIIREESIGTIAYDTSGLNNWSTSSLQKILNSGDYFKRSNNYSNVGLSSESKTMISNVVWNLGGHDTAGVTTSNLYTYERGTKVYTGNATTWTGYVGLMYPSDYGFAVGGSVRSSCLKKDIIKYSTNDCFSNDYLYKSTSWQWTLNSYINNSRHLFAVNPSGLVDVGAGATNEFAVRPVVYLDTKLLITKGRGTLTNPYIISFEEEVQENVDQSNATPPKIDAGGKLIPVTLADDGKVTMVSKDDKKWYNYSEKKWANAVILNDSPSQNYKVGDNIKEADIESYFVWIPKYKYKLWNTGTTSKNAHEIDIVFDTKDTTDVEGISCKTPMTSGATGNCNNGEYMTHPAFISLGVNGFWVGKFETGYRGASTTAAAQVNSSDSSKIIIKPNVFSWRSNTTYNMFVSSYNYERSLDSHMMKNTEWGAVAYLSHSKYGINREVNINNNSSYKTGYSALPSTDQRKYPGVYGSDTSFNHAYNTPVGYLASTTGNIYGVYDMSGGAYEFMASHMNGNVGSSGFTTTTIGNYNAKYFDIYNSSDGNYTYSYRILGDATGELGPFNQNSDGVLYNSWYGDSGYTPSTINPWFDRGAGCGDGLLAGQFAFYGNPGSTYNVSGSRLVLVG